MGSSELSNFQKFQQILTKRPLTTVPEDNDAESKLPAPIPSRVSSSDRSEQGERSSIVPFLRQTFRWDADSHLYLESREAPDEDWTIWKVLTTNETPRAWVRHQKTFNALGAKAVERLVIRADNTIFDILTEAEDDSSNDDLSDQREGGYRTRGDDPEVFFHRCYNAVIDESSFRALFIRYNDIEKEIATTSSEWVMRVLTILMEFLDYTFSDAREGYQDACRTGQVLFHHAWTLFRAGDIVYEKRPVAPFQDVYEQCFSVHSCKDSVSHHDGTRVLCLILAEVSYRSGQANTPGPITVWTTRYIREYYGVKRITTEDLGIVPFSMMAAEKRNAIKAALIQRGRRFLQISKLPFSFWNYKGPYKIVHRLTGHGAIEETMFSLERRRWQKHTHENVVVDIATSNKHFKNRMGGEFETFHWSEHFTPQEETRAIPSVDFSKDDSATEVLLLTCRGYLPGYLLSSSVYAVGILVSELRPPIWASQSLPPATASLIPDTTQWRGLVHDFLEGDKDLEAELGRHQARGSGLVLALEGSKMIVRKVANEISSHLEKPSVCINILDEDLNLEEATQVALRWGAILFLEFRNMPSNLFRVLDLRNYASFYPSVMLISCNSTKELGDPCEDAIDSVISCTLPLEDEPTILWELAITEQTPELSSAMSNKRLSEICQFLAQLEIGKTRMEKILKTAKRMAVTERVQLSLKHIVAVIRLSVAPDKLSEFESVARMGMDKLGYN